MLKQRRISFGIGFMMQILLLITLNNLALRQLFCQKPIGTLNKILILVYTVCVILSKIHFWNLSVGAALLPTILKLLLPFVLLFLSVLFHFPLLFSNFFIIMCFVLKLFLSEKFCWILDKQKVLVCAHKNLERMYVVSETNNKIKINDLLKAVKVTRLK